MLLAPAAGAQVAAEPSASVVGTACLDLDGDGRCGPDDEPLAGQRVLADNGLVSTTDENGRFSLAALGARSEATTANGTVVGRLPHASVRLLTRGLGPGAIAPLPVVVDLVPGSISRVELAVSPPQWRDDPWVGIGALAELPIGALLRDGQLVARVPGRAPGGHAVFVDGAPVDVGDGGAFVVDVPLVARRSAAAIVDIAPDGRVRAQRLEVEAVRHEGDRVSLFADVIHLFTIDLPRPGSEVAGDRLRTPFVVERGAIAEVNGVALEGSGVRWLPLPANEPVLLRARLAGVTEPVLALAVDVRRTAGEPLGAAMVDLRVGWAGNVAALNDTPNAFFADGALRGAGATTIGPVSLDGAVELTDRHVADALRGQWSYAPNPTSALDRWLGVEAPPMLGDESRTVALNPAGLPFTGRARAFDVEVGVGAARTGLDGGLTGRLDRPVAGAWIEGTPSFGPLQVTARGGVDAASIPTVGAGFRSAHAELIGTGGAVYRLPHHDVVVGSERLWVETSDPLTGFVRTRRALERGRDYDLDYRSGLILLAAPLGRDGFTSYGEMAGGDALLDHRLVGDYAVPDVDARGGVLAGTLGLDAFGVGLAVRGARHTDDNWGLLGAEARIQPASFFEAEGSITQSFGEPFAGAADFQRSYDGGTSFSSQASARPEQGTAYAARARLGEPNAGVLAFASHRDEGYRDASTRADGRASELGVEARFDAGFARTGLHASARDARFVFAPDGQRARVVGGGLRTTLPVAAALDLSLEGTSRDVTLYEGRLNTSGRAVGAGIEATVHTLPELDLLVGHTQGIWTQGTGPGARDLTVTSVGAQFHDDAGTFTGRVGLRPDGTLTAGANWTRPDDDGGEAYGSFGLQPDDPFEPAGVATVTGARAPALPGVAVFAESRMVTDPLVGLSAGQALGGDIARGPFRIGAHYERTRRVVFASGGESEGGHVRVGFVYPSVSAHAFAEARRGGPLGLEDGAVTAFGGADLQLRLLREIQVLGRAVIGQALTDAQPLLYARVGGSYRPTFPVAVFSDYTLRQDLAAPTDVAADIAVQQHVGTVRTVFGALPFVNATVTARGRVTRVLEGDETLATNAATLTARGGLPLWIFEPAIEVGGRVVTGGGLGLEPGFTTRVEGALLIGLLRAGVGVVVAGYTGDGLEDPALGLDPPQRFYGFVQGVL